MGRPFIVVGDRTDHGGIVIGSTQTTDTHGMKIARIGDQVTCPKKGHGTTVIVTGDPTMIIDGAPAARHGDKCACGATLIASQFVSTTSDGGGTSSKQAQIDAATAAGIATAMPEVKITYDEMTRLVIADNTAVLVGLPWFIKTRSGKTYSGRTSDSGELPRIMTELEEPFDAIWGDDALLMAAGVAHG